MKKHEEQSPSSSNFKPDSKKSKGSHESKNSDPEYKSDSSDTILPCIPDLRSEADTMRKSLFEEGLISELQLKLLKKCEEGEDYSIFLELLFDPSSIEKFYQDYFESADELYGQIVDTLHKDPAGVEKERMDDLLKRLKDVTDRVGGCKISNEVNKMTRAFEERDIEGIKSALEQVKMEHENLFKKIDDYFQLVGRLHSYEALDLWVKLGLPGSGSAAEYNVLESSTDTGSSGTEESSNPQAGPSGTGESSQL